MDVDQKWIRIGLELDWQVWFVQKVCKQVHDGLDSDC